MTKDDIRMVQRLLRALGRDVAIDGIIGAETRAALSEALRGATAVPASPGADPETALLMAELLRDEGCVLHAYADSLGFLTIGIGRLIDKRKGGGITREEADILKRNDVAKVRAQLDERLPWWRSLSPVRQRAVQNMAFQLGIDGLLGFKNSLAKIHAGDWRGAAANLRASKWAKQTPERAGRVIRMIETDTA